MGSFPVDDSALAVLKAMQAVGYALWQIQVLEGAMMNHLLLAHDVEPGCGKEAFLEAHRRRAGRTFGHALNALRAATATKPTLPAELWARLDVFRDERNWLAHHSRKDCHVALNNATERETVFARLDAIGEEALSLMKAVQAATEVYLTGRGLTPGRLLATFNEIREHWQRGERHPDEVVDT